MERCPKCGSPLPEGAPRDFCAKCLLEKVEVADPRDLSGESSSAPQEAARAAPPVAIVREGAGSVIGPYKLLQRLGEGGFGVVFMAEQREPVRRRVALKIIKQGMDTEQVIARFEAERQALAMMDHPGIAKMLDAGTTDSGRPYFVMELVRGVPITRFCDEHRLGIEERLDLFADVCQAVQHAHQKGIIHRDLKPSNILVGHEKDGGYRARIIDFGIAKATEQPLTGDTLFTRIGQFVGTPVYMCPEQARLDAGDIDTRADVYSLGVILYELLTGTLPLDPLELGSSDIDSVRRIIRDRDAPRPSAAARSLDPGKLAEVTASRRITPERLDEILRRELDWIVLKAIEKERHRRYPTANSLREDIRRYMRNDPILAIPPSRTYQFRKFVGRHRGPVAAGMAFAIVLLAASVTASWLAVRAAEAENLATQRAVEAEREAERARRILSYLRGVFFSYDPASPEYTFDEAIDEASSSKQLKALEHEPEFRASIQSVLALARSRDGNHTEAVALAREASSTLAEVLGPDHPDSLTARESLARLLSANGEYEEAARILGDVLALRITLNGLGHAGSQRTAWDFVGHELVLRRDPLKHPALAETHLEFLLAHQPARSGGVHVFRELQRASTIYRWAEYCRFSGDTGRARTLYLALFKQFSGIPPNFHRDFHRIPRKGADLFSIVRAAAEAYGRHFDELRGLEVERSVFNAEAALLSPRSEDYLNRLKRFVDRLQEKQRSLEILTLLGKEIRERSVDRGTLTVSDLQFLRLAVNAAHGLVAQDHPEPAGRLVDSLGSLTSRPNARGIREEPAEPAPARRDQFDRQLQRLASMRNEDPMREPETRSLLRATARTLYSLRWTENYRSACSRFADRLGGLPVKLLIRRQDDEVPVVASIAVILHSGTDDSRLHGFLRRVLAVENPVDPHVLDEACRTAAMLGDSLPEDLHAQARLRAAENQRADPASERHRLTLALANYRCNQLLEAEEQIDGLELGKRSSSRALLTLLRGLVDLGRSGTSPEKFAALLNEIASSLPEESERTRGDREFARDHLLAALVAEGDLLLRQQVDWDRLAILLRVSAALEESGDFLSAERSANQSIELIDRLDTSSWYRELALLRRGIARNRGADRGSGDDDVREALQTLKSHPGVPAARRNKLVQEAEAALSSGE